MGRFGKVFLYSLAQRIYEGQTQGQPIRFCGATVFAWLRKLSSLMIQQFHACLGEDSRKAGARFKFQGRQSDAVRSLHCHGYESLAHAALLGIIFRR